MKNILHLVTILVASLSLFSCTKEEKINVNSQPKEYIVSLGCAGEISNVSYSDLTKADESNDLYGVQVYSKVKDSEGNYSPYAYGLFTSLEGVSIKLLDGYQYKFVATMVVDGKSRLHHTSGLYWSPFSVNSNGVGISTSFVYSSLLSANWFGYGHSYLQESTIYPRPDIDRYYGEYSDYLPSNGGSVTIDMKRTVFGLKVIADGLTEGSLSIKMNDAPEITINNPNTETDKIFTFDSVYNAWKTDNYKETISVAFSWTKADGAVIPIATKSFDFYRLKKTIITVTISDMTEENGLSVTLEDGAITDGESAAVDGGDSTDTNVNTNK